MRIGGSRIGECGLDLLTPYDTLQSLIPHEPFYRAAGHRNAFPVHLAPDLVGTIDFPVCLPDTFNILLELLVPLLPLGPQLRIADTGRMPPIG